MVRLGAVSILLGSLLGCPPSRPEMPAAAAPESGPPGAAPARPEPAEPAAARSRPAASRPSAGAASRPAAPTERPSAARAAAARARLRGSEAGRLLLASAEAHGGLAAWFGLETLGFRYDYRPEAGARRDSFQIVDLLASTAWHEIRSPVRGTFAFDGERAWTKLEGDARYPARFWALTPYYFVGMPFVLSDPGVRLAVVDDDPGAAGFPEGTRVLRATFAPGTGDAPDDYYVLYLDGDDARLLGLRYVVSYAPFMKPGMDHTPEKLVVYEDLEPLAGLRLARRHVFFAFAQGVRGERVTVAEVSELRPGAPLPDDKLEPPAGAVIDDSLEAR